MALNGIVWNHIGHAPPTHGGGNEVVDDQDQDDLDDHIKDQNTRQAPLHWCVGLGGKPREGGWALQRVDRSHTGDGDLEIGWLFGDFKWAIDDPYNTACLAPFYMPFWNVERVHWSHTGDDDDNLL